MYPFPPLLIGISHAREVAAGLVRVFKVARVVSATIAFVRKFNASVRIKSTIIDAVAVRSAAFHYQARRIDMSSAIWTASYVGLL